MIYPLHHGACAAPPIFIRFNARVSLFATQVGFEAVSMGLIFAADRHT